MLASRLTQWRVLKKKKRMKCASCSCLGARLPIRVLFFLLKRRSSPARLPACPWGPSGPFFSYCRTPTSLCDGILSLGRLSIQAIRYKKMYCVCTFTYLLSVEARVQSHRFPYEPDCILNRSSRLTKSLPVHIRSVVEALPYSSQ